MCGNLADGTNSSKRDKYIFTLSKRTELQRKAKVTVPLGGGHGRCYSCQWPVTHKDTKISHRQGGLRTWKHGRICSI